MSIIQNFLAQVSITPDKPALIFGDECLTYEQLAQKVSSLSASLLDAGVEQNDHVGVLLPNSIEFAILMLVAANIGLVLVPQNMSLGQAALARSIEASDIKHFVVWHGLISDLNELRNSSLDDGSVWVSVGQHVDDKNTEYLSFSVLLNHSPDQNFGDHNIPGEQAFILTMTSGSTGDPKPIVLSQKVKESRAQAAIALYDVTKEDIILIATPMYHSLAERLLLMPLMIGATSVIMASYTARRWLDEVNKNNVSFSIIVSSQLKQVMSELEKSVVTLGSLRCLVSSSERLPERVRDNVFKFFHCDFHECYGTSEIAIATNLNYQTNYVDSVGQTIQNVDVKIIDENGKVLKAGQAGEIACKTPMLFSGYYKKKRETESSMLGGFFCTGDIGKLDSDGYLTFLGRKKDIIITGGINIYPKDIEDVISKHESVSACAVIPITDDALGEKITAVVVPIENKEVPIKEIQRLCAKELADYQQPRMYLIDDSLPKNAMGKVMKQQLIERYQSKASD
jgi:acyl-CoA synthetase (AMP-forming)/AMP-acid ligase II